MGGSESPTGRDRYGCLQSLFNPNRKDFFFTNVLGFLQEKVKSYSRRLIHAFGIAADQDPQKIGQDNFIYTRFYHQLPRLSLIYIFRLT